MCPIQLDVKVRLVRPGDPSMRSRPFRLGGRVGSMRGRHAGETGGRIFQIQYYPEADLVALHVLTCALCLTDCASVLAAGVGVETVVRLARWSARWTGADDWQQAKAGAVPSDDSWRMEMPSQEVVWLSAWWWDGVLWRKTQATWTGANMKRAYYVLDLQREVAACRWCLQSGFGSISGKCKWECRHGR